MEEVLAAFPGTRSGTIDGLLLERRKSEERENSDRIIAATVNKLSRLTDNYGPVD